MNKAVKVLVFAIVLFSGAAGVSWYLQQQMHPHTDPHAADAHEKSAKSPAPTPSGGGDAKLTRAAVRPAYVPESENVAKMAASLQQQGESLKGREQELTARQKNLELIYQDIRSEHRALEEVRKQLAEEMKALQDKLSTLETKAGENKLEYKNLAKKREEISSSLLEVHKTEAGRLKQIGSAYDTMDPEAAATMMQEMVEKGMLDTAVKILGSMKDRQLARVLAAFTEPSIAVQLLDRLKGLKANKQPAP
jgi:flagellar motility protein MotE (MotC chaperone)